MTDRSGHVPRNFGRYAAMEAGNAVLLPALALWIAWPTGLAEAIAMALAIVAASGLLIVGALYWRAQGLRLHGRGNAANERAVAIADQAQRPALLACASAVAASATAFALQGSTPSMIAAALVTFLAVLEYVNYYHRQLQHFDNLADLRRLLSTPRLRRSHLARDLAVYRGKRR